MKLNWRTLSVPMLLTFAFLSLSACSRGRAVEAAHEDQASVVSATDQDFMRKATEANLTEIDVARIAKQKSVNEDVRDFANMIESDHTSALEDLTDLMKARGIPEPKNLAAETRNDIDRMDALNGPEFDREFVNMMVADHQKALELFRDESANAQNPDVKKYVDALLPKLEMHLEKAHQLQSKLFRGAS